MALRKWLPSELRQIREEHHARLAAIGLTSIALLSLAIAVPAGGAIALQTQHVSFKASAENSKYTQQQFLDVGDVPGHQVQSFEIHRTFPATAAVIAGMKIKDKLARVKAPLS